jgi:HAD superfamily hydrolase (TIGR01509 family)
MNMTFEAVIFDCDGTLVDSEGLANEVFAECAVELGIQIGAQDALELFRGRSMPYCITRLENMLGRPLPEWFVPKFRDRPDATFREKLRPIEGAVELVQSISVPICVASSGPRDKIELTLGLCGLLQYFEGRIFSSYEVGIWKPDPGLFLHAAKQLGIDPRNCVVVEDSLTGIEAAIAAGMTVFALNVPRDQCSAAANPISVLSDLHRLRLGCSPVMDRAPARQSIKQVDRGWLKIRSFGNDSRSMMPAIKHFLSCVWKHLDSNFYDS